MPRPLFTAKKLINQGFTLIELLLGLVIAAIIGMTIYNLFWSSMRLDDRMHRVYNNYIEVLMADQALTHDLENAVPLDFSASYPDAVVFDGKADEFSFLTQTTKGIKRVRYYVGNSSGEASSESQIGRITNPSHPETTDEKDEIEYLLRQESSLGDWLNETTSNTSVQIVAASLEKGSFNCQYAPFSKDLHTQGAQAIDYTDSWTDNKLLPLAVSCSFVIHDSKNTQQNLKFKRDIFLAPVPSYYNAQQ